MKYKFRGTATGENGYRKGKFYYGMLSFDSINEVWEIVFEDENGWNFVPVTNYSILIAVDAKGVEIYDGDDVWYGKGSHDTWKATFTDFAAVREGSVFAYKK